MNKRLLSMFLALCLVLSMLPVSAMAQEVDTTIVTSEEIINFAPLEEAEKTVITGTSIEDLNLPKTLTATVGTTVVAEKESAQDLGNQDMAADLTATESEWQETIVDIPITWTSKPEYNVDIKGTYIFTPLIEGYTVKVDPPEITVEVEEAPMTLDEIAPDTITPDTYGTTFIAPITIGSNTDVKWKFIVLTEPDGETNGTVTIYSPYSGAEQMYTGDLFFPETVTNYGKTYDVTEISGHCFNSCRMSSVFIPKTIGGSIGPDTFVACPNLVAINVDPENTTFMSEDGVLYNKDKTTLIRYPSAKSGESFAIPESVNTLLPCAFYACKNLTTMTIPDNITTVGSHIFYKCDALTEVTIGVGVSEINHATFIDCTALQLITFNRMTAPTLARYAFASNPIDISNGLKFQINVGSTGYIGEEASDEWKLLADKFIPINHDVWVDGVQVTSANASDVLGDGTVSYAPITGGTLPTLTLTNANITNAYEYDYNPFSKAVAGILVNGDLNLVLVGNNSIGGSSFDTTGASSAGIYVRDGDLNILGTGSLTATAGKLYSRSLGMSVENFEKNLTISGEANVTAIGGSAFYSDGVFTNGSLTIDGASLTAMSDSIGESTKSCGVNLGYENSNLTIINGGSLNAVGGNATYESSGVFFNYLANPIIIDDATLTASAAHQAISVAPTFGVGFQHKNTAGLHADGSGAIVISDSTLASGITNYKYVKIEPFIKKTPTISDLTYDLLAVDYDGTAKPLSVTAVSGKTLGAITIKYNGSTTKPIDADTYAVTVDIAGNDEYNSVTGLYLGDYIINKIAYNGTTALSTSVLASGQSRATVILPTLPAGASYSTPIASGKIKITDMSITGSTLTYTASASKAGENATMTIPVTGATNYKDYNILVTVTSTAKAPQMLYTVKVKNGTGSGSYAKGATVTVTAKVRSGYTFKGWSSDSGVTFTDKKANTTTFKMPAKAVTVTANYSKKSSKDSENSNEGTKTNQNNNSDNTTSNQAITDEGTKVDTLVNQNANGSAQGVTSEQTKNRTKSKADKPYLLGEEEKSGWEAILAEIEASSSKAMQELVMMTVEMNGVSKVPANVLEALRGQNINLILDMGDGIIWTIHGMDVSDGQLFDIDLGVTRNTSVIPEDVVNSIRGENNGISIELAHDGAFGFGATLTIAFDEKEAGKFANLFYYNEETGKLEYMESTQVGEGGKATLTFVHASAYTVVLSHEVINESALASITDTSSNQTNENTMVEPTQEQATKETKGSMMAIWILLGIIGVIVIGGTTIYIERNQAGKEEDEV
ncbi:MAG: leucine-rich repeat protein [Candidatus Galacturonibacter soehngenii]|nr:leucine-rich repeat protein [Candidatus Galacturonibacter soehngenii]